MRGRLLLRRRRRRGGRPTGIECGVRHGRRTRCALFALTMVLALMRQAEADTPSPSTEGIDEDNIAAPGEQIVYLAVQLNGRDTGKVIRCVLRAGRVFARPMDLEPAGLALQRLGLAPDQLLPLDAIPGLEHTYDAARQMLVLHADNDLRQPFVHGRDGLAPVPAATSGRGLVLNYDAYFQHERRSQLSLWNELRFFSPSGVLESTGATYISDRDNDYVRFDTFWTRSYPDTMRTLRIGDTISSGLDWSRPVRMAGIQWSSNFELRPDLVTFPVPRLTGSAAVPSTVDLYINNVRRAQTQVPEGPFLLNDAPGITGAATATIVTRDALGRAVMSSLPLYIDRRMLAQGLSVYSAEAGFLRRRYGYKSFEYDGDPAGSATLRYGLSDYLTLEGHAEAMPRAYNAGGGALLRLGTYGVINAGVSASAGSGSGTRATLGYQWIQPRFALDLQTTRSFGDYWDLGGTDGFPAPRQIDRATLSLSLANRQSLAFSYIGYRSEDYAPSRIGSIAYTASLSDRVSMNLSAYKDFGPQQDKGFFLSVNISLDSGAYVGAYAGRQNKQASYNLTAMRSPDYNGGWGWGLQAGHTASRHWEQAQASYRGRYGEVSALVQDYDGQGGVGVNASGAIVLMDGSVSLSRRIHDGFAMVSTGDASGVPVLHENRVMGKTNSRGHLLVPDLNAYQRNRISIDSLDLPANMKVEEDTRIVVPQTHSGVLVTFPIAQYRAATMILRSADGTALPVGARVLHRESGMSTIVGYDGMTFIENLDEENHLQVDYDDVTCMVRFAYEGNAGAALPTLGPLTCERK